VPLSDLSPASTTDAFSDAFSNYRVERCREEIAARNLELRAVLHVVPEPASRRRAPGRGPLDGVPFVLKDSWDSAGVPTTGGALRYKDRVPSSSSHAADALFETGAVLLGKSNVADMCLSAESDNHLIGAARNPYDLGRTAGGSTGGGAAAVASGMAAFDWGTDFGGSVRMPAAFCGLVGLRLSASAWPVGEHHFPRIGPFFWPYLAMGPLTRTVDQAEALVRLLAPALRTGEVAEPAPLGDASGLGDVALLAPDRAHQGMWPGFAEEVAAHLARQGLRASVEAALPTPTRAQLLFDATLAGHLRKLAGPGEMGVRKGAIPVLAGLLTWGKLDKRVHPHTAFNLAMCGLGALALRPFRGHVADHAASLRASVRSVWRSGRLVVSPMCARSAPRHGRSLLDPSLLTFGKYGNLVDATAVAVPFGAFADGLPRSVQVMGPAGAEDAVLALARRLFTPSRRE
jgi:Asp-tRNA(Asn)/Glu-tRNA(Gln) amidotransferase A subunit family amidase